MILLALGFMMFCIAAVFAAASLCVALCFLQARFGENAVGLSLIVILAIPATWLVACVAWELYSGYVPYL